MAASIETSLLRQVRQSLPSCRAFAKQPSSISRLAALHTSSARRRSPSSSIIASTNLNFANSPPHQSQSIAAFHTSGRRAILPAEPQVIDGTANDPAPVPTPSPTHGSYHWAFERLISAALIPLTVAPFAAGTLNPATDAILCATILIHSHIGFESVIIDYLPKKRVPKTRAIAWWGLRAGTVIVGIGFYEFETNDVGVTEAIKRIWKA